ncbi:LRR receptor kinase SERK2 [Populus nigra]|uniref:LRR receptor kinase SERK2 n=1 Tax=Populus nigra TaxID=3691 RepID=UPI002B2698AA|nr:LRR receptor kinase SERK2 [Populus nigra]
MASLRFLLLFTTLSLTVSSAISGSVVEDLANLQPPSDFNTTVMKNCQHNPSLRYCNSSSMDLKEIFKFTIVASHLCNESKNPNCVHSFDNIDLRNRPKMAPLYLSYSFFWKYCPLTILSIDLSNISLKGSFPKEVICCDQIQALDLSLNGLTGEFPIESFAPLTNLTSLNLSYNYFSESKISDSQFFKRFNASSFIYSGILPSDRNYTIKAIFLLVGFPISVILMAVCFGWLCFQRPDYLPRMFQRKHKFTPSMLRAATNGFSRKNQMVRSEGVEIYKGTLRDSTQVRIEIYRGCISREKRKEFVEECKVLVELCHKNLVQVLGWCSNRNQRAIVTEWTDGETIEMWLSGSAPPWKQRLKMLIGVVDGMRYLQEHWPEVVYDLRINSVLLSDNHEPLLSRFQVGDQYSNNKKIHKFGIFLLEIITNRRSQEFERGEAGLIEDVRDNYPENLHKVIDARKKLPENMFDQAKHGIELGLMCTDQSISKHPSLNQISHMINKVYESCLELAPQNHKRSHGDGGKGHKHVQ